MEATPMIVGDIKTHTSIIWMLKATHLLKEGRHKMRRLMSLKATNLMPRHHTTAKDHIHMERVTVKIMMNTFLSKNANDNDNDNSKPKLKPAKK